MGVKLTVIAGRSVPNEVALAFKIRDTLAHEGLPVIVHGDDIKRTDGHPGWHARAAWKRSRGQTTPVVMLCDDPVEKCLQGITYQFAGIDRLLIAAKSR